MKVSITALVTEILRCWLAASLFRLTSPTVLAFSAQMVSMWWHSRNVPFSGGRAAKGVEVRGPTRETASYSSLRYDMLRFFAILTYFFDVIEMSRIHKAVVGDIFIDQL